MCPFTYVNADGLPLASTDLTWSRLVSKSMHQWRGRILQREPDRRGAGQRRRDRLGNRQRELVAQVADVGRPVGGDVQRHAGVGCRSSAPTLKIGKAPSPKPPPSPRLRRKPSPSPKPLFMFAILVRPREDCDRLTLWEDPMISRREMVTAGVLGSITGVGRAGRGGAAQDDRKPRAALSGMNQVDIQRIDRRWSYGQRGPAWSAASWRRSATA